LVRVPEWQAAAAAQGWSAAVFPPSGYLVQRTAFDGVSEQFALLVWSFRPGLFYARRLGDSYGNRQLLLARSFPDVAQRDAATAALARESVAEDLHHVPVSADWVLIVADDRTRLALGGRFGAPTSALPGGLVLGAHVPRLATLAGLHSEAAVFRLLELLDDATLDSEVRAEVWRALIRTELGTARLCDRFRKQLDHPLSAVREAAKRGLESVEALHVQVHRTRDDNHAIAALMEMHH